MGMGCKEMNVQKYIILAYNNIIGNAIPKFDERGGSVMKRMMKGLALLLSLCLLMSACGALADITQEDMDKPYDPPINLTAWRFLSSAIQFENGDTIEKNIYIDRFLSDLGINLTYDWVVAEEQFDQKMNVSIVSGDLPDLMWLKAAQLKELAQEGELYDLTDLFDKYANQYAKDTLMADMKQFDTAKVDGRLYAIPHRFFLRLSGRALHPHGLAEQAGPCRAHQPG